MTAPILSVDDLRVSFPTPHGELHAVRGISFNVAEGQVFGIVGESGCGKSVTGRAILGLVPPPGRIVGGRICYRGEDLAAKSEPAMRGLRGRRIAMVFQDPAAALNPLFTVGSQIVAVMRQHRIAKGGHARRRAVDLMGELGLPRPEDVFDRYPHQLSGGMQQRIMLCMALAAEPDLIIADEATTALDVTIQAQILELLSTMQRRRSLTLVFITHDLGLVAEICDHVAVLYMGRIVEEGDPESIFHKTRHPYTEGLLAALPSGQTWREPLNVIPGSVPSGTAHITGCSFAPRCASVMPRCSTTEPPDVRFAGSHRAACHLYGDDAVPGETP